MSPSAPHLESHPDASPIGALLVVTFLQSVSTGVFWNAIAFITKHGYGFSEQRNLVLYAVMGAVYTLGAWRAGAFLRRLRPWFAPRTIIIFAMIAESIVCAGPVVVDGEWAIWLAVVVIAFCSSLLWPTIESYLTAGRHGARMRSALGWFNVTWMSAVALPLFVMAPFVEHDARSIIAALTVINLLTIIPLFAFPRAPGRHDVETAAAHRSDNYPFLLSSARILLLLSYLLNAAMSPILPYRFEAIGTRVDAETPATATWMVVRIVAMIVMWATGFWHGRWGTLLLGALAMSGGFGTIVLAPSLPIMLIGFGAFGIGVGMIYYAGLYYAMSVGHAEIDAGGTHEALIGSGYTVGPIAGLVGVGAAGVLDVPTGLPIVVIVMTVLLAGLPFALRPYLAARRASG